MKHILFLLDANSIHSKKWVDYFIDEKYEISIITFSKKNITKCTNTFFLSCQDINVSGRNFYYLLAIPKIIKILKSIKPQYVNAHYSYSMGLVALLSLKLSGINADFSVVCHGSDILRVPRPHYIFEQINNYVLRRANKIFAVSTQITNYIRKFEINDQRIFTGQYGIQQDVIVYDQQKDLKDIDIISNRSYVNNSRIDEMLRALNYPAFYNKKIVFVLPCITGERLKVLQREFPFITFYKELPQKQLMTLVARSKFYISATLSDGTSLSLLEAMANGCYPLVSNIPANVEWVLNGDNGNLFHTFEEFQRILLDLLIRDNNEILKKSLMNIKLVKEQALYEHQMPIIEKFLTIKQL